ncbi:HNH endonuclease [Hymenobacter ruber]
MFKINTPIVFDKAQQQIITSKKGQPGFTYLNWSDDDLEALRSSIRSFYRNEQGGICAYCRKSVSLVAAGSCHVEHIAPKSLHECFMFEPKNLCVICADCNLIKRNQETIHEIQDTILKENPIRYPRATGSFKIVHPHFDDYDAHIKIFAGKVYVNKTLKGHFTIGVCDLNRWFAKFGWEKPIYSLSDVMSVINKIAEEKDPLHQVSMLSELKEILLLVIS